MLSLTVTHFHTSQLGTSTAKCNATLNVVVFFRNFSQLHYDWPWPSTAAALNYYNTRQLRRSVKCLLCAFVFGVFTHSQNVHTLSCNRSNKRAQFLLDAISIRNAFIRRSQ